MAPTIRTLLNLSEVQVGGALWVISEDAVGEALRANGVLLQNITTDPEIYSYLQLVPGFFELTLTHGTSPIVVDYTYPFDWVSGIYVPDYGPTPAPVVTVAQEGAVALKITWTPSVELDPLFPVLSYVVTRYRYPSFFPEAANEIEDFSWTVDPSDPLEVIDEPLTWTNQGPRIGRDFWYQVVAVTAAGSSYSELASGRVAGPTINTDGFAYRIGDPGLAPGGGGDLTEVTEEAGTIVAGDGITLDGISYRVGDA